MKFSIAVLLGAAAWLAGPHAQAIVAIDYITVGNPGNAPDQNYGQGAFGAVSQTFAIGKYEVTNTQYTEFLNTVDPAAANSFSLYNASMSSDARGGINRDFGAPAGSKFSLKTGYENRPVVFVSFMDAIRFANWLNNGQGSGSTETGAYTLSLGGLAPRNAGATVWVPSENEWYKAAYHQPVAQGGDADNYWLYPTRSNAIPNSRPPNGTDPNSANFIRDDGSPDDFLNDGYATTGSTTLNNALNYLTDVGAYTQSGSFYGTFDQGGNTYEWNDAVIGSGRGGRGGSWFFGDENDLRASFRPGGSNPTNEGFGIGFRVATVPEPSCAMLMIGSALMWLARRRRGSSL